MYKRQAHWGVQPENILCGNGSDENLLLALRAFCDESTPLAFADVTYSFYTVLCDLDVYKRQPFALTLHPAPTGRSILFHKITIPYL